MTATYSHRQRHEGTRWIVVVGSGEGAGRFAVNELQREVQRHLPYVVGIHREAGGELLEQNHVIALGTSADNPLVAEAVRRGLVAPPPGAEGYSVVCRPSPWGADRKAIVIAGSDERGVLYGVEDFCARVASRLSDSAAPAAMRRAFDGIGDCAFSERPLVDNRGIWTWGYVVYDYRRFLDNMARLRLNMLTVWNDCPPLNCRAVVDYAHSRGVRLVLGFPWGWGTKDLDLSRKDHRERIKQDVLRDYRENYRGLGMDGIYFQTLTEHNQTALGGRTVASLACELVNDVAGALLAEEPNLYIQFGLHATSIMENYGDLRALDPRVVIVWEDAGVLPYTYNAQPVPPAKYKDARLFATPESTIEYSKRLATFRPGAEFAMVPKGWMALRWEEDFEHHGPFILGERDREFIRRRLEERQPRWDKINERWMRHYPLAVRFYREILDCRPPRMTATALVEDGLFEECIQPSVALFAETIWNPRREPAEILELALSPYYRRER